MLYCETAIWSKSPSHTPLHTLQGVALIPPPPGPQKFQIIKPAPCVLQNKKQTHRTRSALLRSQQTLTQSFESALPSEEEERQLELAEALGWKNPAREAFFMPLAGDALLGSSTA